MKPLKVRPFWFSLKSYILISSEEFLTIVKKNRSWVFWQTARKFSYNKVCNWNWKWLASFLVAQSCLVLLYNQFTHQNALWSSYLNNIIIIIWKLHCCTLAGIDLCYWVMIPKCALKQVCYVYRLNGLVCPTIVVIINQPAFMSRDLFGHRYIYVGAYTYATSDLLNNYISQKHFYNALIDRPEYSSCLFQLFIWSILYIKYGTIKRIRTIRISVGDFDSPYQIIVHQVNPQPWICCWKKRYLLFSEWGL